ncbi:phosphoribosyltransferase [Allorhizocola rhizosphaerae]|uniref:phosphoribosyltransferase n=1 Tax=Allorhizocola rhizosphaerae TaxID=1872709 RepID=UPI000E3CAC6C|nr:phosphoribosyltransferase family protein [Allorhizocola rhizosphaerae]
MRPFRDRTEAGERLAERVRHLAGESPVVLGLPRGGVAVAARVARALGAPLDVIVVRKLGFPGQPELAMGAIGEDNVRVSNEGIMSLADPDRVAAVEHAEREELRRRVDAWRAGRPAVPLHGRTVVIVDDGIATGATAAVACQVARLRGAARVILAVPVAPPEAVGELADAADEVIAVLTPAGFSAVGQWYRDFAPTTNDEVTRFLAAAAP